MIIKPFLNSLGIDFMDLYELFPEEQEKLKKLAAFKRFADNKPTRRNLELLEKSEMSVMHFLLAPQRIDSVFHYIIDRQRKPRPEDEYLEGYDYGLKYGEYPNYFTRGELPFDADGSLVALIRNAETQAGQSDTE